MNAPAPSANTPVRGWVRVIIGGLVRLGLAIYFRRIERFHTAFAPRTGPVLFVSNHPGSVTDAFLIAVSVPRPVYFVATVKLFKGRFLSALLKSCGIVPINRKQDDPTAMATVSQTFEHCFRVLEDGGAVGIFPEGVSYNDEQMRPVKTGAARMALEIEDRHSGGLGLRIAPVGLTYTAKGKYRADVLANFGEAFPAAEWLDQYHADRHQAVRALSSVIEQRIRDLILHLPSLEHQRIVASVKRLYLDRLREHNLIVTEPVPPRAEELILSQAIADALAYFEAQAPERLAAFVDNLDRYEQRLARLGLANRGANTLGGSAVVKRPGSLALLGLALGAPFALYGWLHRLVPVWFTEWAVEKFSPKENVRAQVAHGSMIAGLFGFGIVYLTAATAMWYLAGGTIAAIYLLSLPVTGLFAVRYYRLLRRVVGESRAAGIFLRLPLARRNLTRTRARLIREIETFRSDFRRDVLRVPGVS